MPTRFELEVPSSGVKLRVAANDVASQRGVIVIVPGFADHAGRWVRVQDELASRGYSSYAYDPRGHGRSTGPRGHTPHWGALLDDLTAVFDALERERRITPRVGVGLMGASVGGLVAIEWAVANVQRIKALALISPFIVPALSIPPHKLALAHTFGRLLPRLAQSHGMKGKSLSHDASVISSYDLDPLQTRVMTARFFLEMRAAQERVKKLGARIECPVIVVAGGEDGIASVPAMEAWARSVPEARCRLTVYPGLFHEPLNENVRNQVFGDLVHWLDRAVVGQSRFSP